MKGLWYEHLNATVCRTPQRKRRVQTICVWLPRAVAAGYLCVLLCLICLSNTLWVRFVAVPACVFLLVTVLRQLLPFLRPYEVCDIEPLLPNKHPGHSLPSRHTASAAIIALGGWYVHPVLGTIFTVAAVGVAVTRLLAGVHFIRDLLAAFGLALLVGIPAFWLI